MAYEIKNDREQHIFDEFREKFDTNESMFLTEQLTAFEAEIYNIEYEGYIHQRCAQVQSDGSGLDSVGYYEQDIAGRAKIIGSAADDAPAVNMKRRKVLMAVRQFAAKYGWTYQELQQAIRARLPLESEGARIARDAMELLLEDDFFGHLDSDDFKQYGVPGLLTSAEKFNEVVLPSDGTGSVKNMTKKTPDAFIRDIGDIIEGVYINTRQRHRADTVLMPVEIESFMRKTRLTDTGNNLMTYVQQTFPEVEFLSTSRMKGLKVKGKTSNTVSNTDVIVAYKRDPMVIKYKVPVPFSQLPVERQNLNYNVHCIGDIAGVEIKNYAAFSMALDVLKN